MAAENSFDYYYGDESSQFSFYRIPRQLITGDHFKRLSTDAKLLYGLLLDRMSLSAKNGWYDDQGRVFIYYTLDEIQEDLNCAHGKAVKLLSELDTGNGFGLIERVKQGQGRPTKIYVKRFTTRMKPPQPTVAQDIPRLPIFGSQDFSKSEVKSSEKQKSRLPVSGSADFRKSDASYPYPLVPVYDAVIFCDLHSEPSWVYAQADFTATACWEAGIPFYWLDSNLYGDFTQNFGRARTACIPFWTLGDDGKKGRMPRQCTYDYKIKVIERFVRYELFRYRPRERTLPLDVHAHSLHMGIMWEERRRTKESKQTLFVNRYPLVEMGWTRAECYAYNKIVWGLATRASCCLFCPYHTNYFYHYIREHEPDCYACALQVDTLVEIHQARPPLKSKLFLSKSRKRLRNLTEEDCQDKQTFLYLQTPVWNGF